MFDTHHLYVGRRGSDHVSVNATITEKRAPTDASVRLLKEMEQAALDKILDTIRLDGCPVDCVIVHQRDIVNDEYQFLIKYKLGQRERKVRHTYRPKHLGSAQDMRVEAAAELREALAADIASYLLTEPFAKLVGAKFPSFP